MDWEIVDSRSEKGISGYKVSANERDAIIDIREAAGRKSLISFLCICLTGLAEKKMKHLS